MHIFMDSILPTVYPKREALKLWNEYFLQGTLLIKPLGKNKKYSQKILIAFTYWKYFFTYEIICTNQAGVHITNTSPAEAEIRVERFLGHLFLYVYLHECACLCAQWKKKRKVTLQQKLVLRKCGKSSFKLQQPCKNCSGSTNDVHRSDINRS